MKTILFALAGIASAAGVGAASAQSSTSTATGLVQVSAAPVVPNSALFAGFGGGYNSTRFNHQKLYAQGVSTIYQNGALVAYGSAGGATYPHLESDSSLAPLAQVGYFRHFPNSDWLWGAKLSYNYLDSSSERQNVPVPQDGSFTSSNSASFTGNVVVRSYQAKVKQQLALTPFIGRSFDKFFVYVGAGPSLSETQTDLSGVIGFADLNGTHYNITGQPSDFSSSQWVYGGAAVIGVTYFFDPSWFVDLNYTYISTKVPRRNFAGPFSSSTDGYDDTGILSGTYSGRVDTQAVMISINRAL